MTLTTSASRRVVPAGIVALALGARILAVWLTRHYPLRNDPADYQRIAVSLAHGHGFGRSVIAPGGGPSAFRPPLYPAWLALVYRIIGVHVTAARLLQAALGAVSVGLLGAIACRLFGRRVALVAMALMAVYPAIILSTTGLLSESMAVPLELAAVLVALDARTQPTRRGWLVLLGVLCGAGVLNRPNTALLVLPLVWLAMPSRIALGRAAARAAVVLVALVAVLTPWLVRDATTFHRFVPLTTQEGPVLSGTYNSQAANDHRFPAAFRPANLVPEDDAILRAHPRMGEVEMDSRLTAASVTYARAHALYPVKVVFWNTVRLLDLTGPTWAGLAAQAIGFSRRAADVALAGWYVALALAVVGAFAIRRTRPPVAVWLVPLAVVASTVPFQGETRMRAGVEPFVLLLAAVAISAAPLPPSLTGWFRRSPLRST